MLSKEDYVLVQVIGKDNPLVQALVAASGHPGMEPAVHQMLRGLARQRGWDPDDLPRFVLPQGISESDYVIGTSMSGSVVGEEIGPSDADLPSHVGVFGMTATGKSTLVKLLISAFMEKTSQNIPNRAFCILDMHDEYRDLLRLFGTDQVVWLTADELCINPFEPPLGADSQRVMAPDKWINNIREWLRLFWLNEPSCNLFCEILLDETARCPERWRQLPVHQRHR